MVSCLGGGIDCLLEGVSEDVAVALKINDAQNNGEVEEVHRGVNHDF